MSTTSSPLAALTALGTSAWLDQGAFVQLVGDARPGVEAPGFGYDFAALVRAPAIGDGRALRARDVPFTRVRVDGPEAIQTLGGS